MFLNDYLLGTNHDPGEQLNILGNPNVETGWFKAEGSYAWNVFKSIEDPALMCLMFEWYNDRIQITPPFDNGKKRNNATIWPIDPSGDNED